VSLRYIIALLRCCWKLNGPLPSVEISATANSTPTAPCRTLDLLCIPLSISPWNKVLLPLTDAVDGHAPNGGLWTKPEHGQSKASLFVRDAIRMTIDKHGSSAIALKLLLPTVAGYPVRKDSVQQRFLTCDLVDTVADFTTLRQQIQAFDFGRRGYSSKGAGWCSRCHPAQTTAWYPRAASRICPGLRRSAAFLPLDC